MKLYCKKGFNTGDIKFVEGKKYEYDPENEYIYGGHIDSTIWWKFHNYNHIWNHFCDIKELRKEKLDELENR